MINNSLNVSAINSSSLTAPISNPQSELDKIISEAQDILVDIIDMMVKDLEDAINEAMQNKEAPEEVKDMIKTQIGVVIETLKEQRTTLQNTECSGWNKDPKELLDILTAYGEYLEKSMQTAQEKNDAFKAHALEQKSEQVSKLKTQLETLA